MDFVGSSKIRRVPDIGFFFTPSYNKYLALPTTSIVSVAISNKTRFEEWHASLVVAGCVTPMTFLMFG